MEVTKAVIYARISPRRMVRGEDGVLRPVSDSIDEQLERCRELCAARNWEIVGQFADRLVSGKDDNRPQYQKMRAAAIKHRAAVVAYDLSRVTRSLRDVVLLIEQLQKLNLPLVTVSGKLHLDTTTPQGRLMAHIMIALAEFEREVKSERTSHALQAYYKRLNRPKNPAISYRFGTPPYGKRIETGPDGAQRLVTDIPEFKTLQAIMALDACGLPPRLVAQKINILGLRNRMGLRWNNKTIFQTIRRCKLRRREMHATRSTAKKNRIAASNPEPSWAAAEKAVAEYLENNHEDGTALPRIDGRSGAGH